MLEKAIKAGVGAALIDTMVSMPGIIKSFDPTTQTVSADIAIMRIVDGQNVKYTLVVDIPIILPSVQGFHITMPIKKNDECLIVFADRCIDNWFTNGGVQSQLEHRVHHISDGFAIIGVNSTPGLITSYDPENMVIRNTDNNQKITLKSNGDIEVDTVKDVNINCTNANIAASASVKIDTPATTITGTLTVQGDVTAPKVTADSVIGGGKVLEGHTHTGNLGNPTSAPN